MKNKIAITTESAADLEEDLLKSENVTVLPVGIVIGDEEYLDGESIKTNELYEKSELYGVPPKVEGISPYEYGKLFSSLTDKGFEVIHIALSSKISSCFQNAAFAARSFENVCVIDSLSLSGGMAAMVSEAADLAQKEVPAQDIAAEVEKKKCLLNTSFIIDDIEFIYQGGHCSSVQKKAAELFSVKPSLNVKGGEFATGKLFLGKDEEARKKYILWRLKTENPNFDRPCRLNYSALDTEEVQKLEELIRKNGSFNEVIVNEAGCCLSSYCGKGCVGMTFESFGR